MKSSYLDSATASVERLMKARRNLNLGITATTIFSSIFLFLGLMFYSNTDNLFIVFFVYSILFLIIDVGMIIKREIYSMMIYLKKDKEEKKHD